jgi:hypothetical protein
MDPMNVLVVERDADLTYLAATSHLVGHAMLVLVQQKDENSAAFHARISAKMARIKKQGLASVAVLRGRGGNELSSAALLRELEQHGPTEVRTFPASNVSAAAEIETTVPAWQAASALRGQRYLAMRKAPC